MRQTTLEISLDLLKRNYQILRKRAGSADLLVLLKSDAYGHSHREVSRELDALPDSAGLHGFGVANVEEGIELRREGIRRPVYVMSGIQFYDRDMDRCLETCSLIPVISSLGVLRQADRTTRELGTRRPVHLKFNTGMNRLGIALAELPEVLRLLGKGSLLRVDGLLSHLSAGEKPGAALTKTQTKNFRAVVEHFARAGVTPRFCHLENSAGLAARLYPEGSLARVGLHLYGLGDEAVKPVARWTAQIYQIRELTKGEAVGYGPSFRAPRRMRMAVLGVGYGDGYRRAFSNRAQVLVRGRRCPVIGNVSMDLTAVDITGVPGASPRDRAVLLGRDGREEISAEELAKHAGTISYEILTGISPRVPRIFKKK